MIKKEDILNKVFKCTTYVEATRIMHLAGEIGYDSNHMPECWNRNKHNTCYKFYDNKITFGILSDYMFEFIYNSKIIGKNEDVKNILKSKRKVKILKDVVKHKVSDLEFIIDSLKNDDKLIKPVIEILKILKKRN